MERPDLNKIKELQKTYLANPSGATPVQEMSNYITEMINYIEELEARPQPKCRIFEAVEISLETAMITGIITGIILDSTGYYTYEVITDLGTTIDVPEALLTPLLIVKDKEQRCTGQQKVVGYFNPESDDIEDYYREYGEMEVSKAIGAEGEFIRTNSMEMNEYLYINTKIPFPIRQSDIVVTEP